MPVHDEGPDGAIADLLAEVGEATLRADFAALDRLGDALEAKIEGLPAQWPDPLALARVRELAGRNRALLDAARRGMMDARNRIAEVERVNAGVVTYAPDGRREIEATGAPRTIRRA
jgi:hypothetical protein